MESGRKQIFIGRWFESFLQRNIRAGNENSREPKAKCERYVGTSVHWRLILYEFSNSSRSWSGFVLLEQREWPQKRYRKNHIRSNFSCYCFAKCFAKQQLELDSSNIEMRENISAYAVGFVFICILLWDCNASEIHWMNVSHIDSSIECDTIFKKPVLWNFDIKNMSMNWKRMHLFATIYLIYFWWKYTKYVNKLLYN